jgi:hypothetical protein
MSKVLDLGAIINNETLDIVIPATPDFGSIAGLTLHIRKPSFRDYAMMLSMNEQLQEQQDFEALQDFIVYILNSNIDGVTVTKEDIECFNNDIIQGIVVAYAEHIGAITSNPTIARPANPQAKKTEK